MESGARSFALRALVLFVCGCVSSAVAGCGDEQVTPDGGTQDMGPGPDQAVASPCAVDNGGCSTMPMVACEQATDGSAQCAACPTGYQGDGRTCASETLIDECALETDNCPARAICVDTPGAFTCTPPCGAAGEPCCRGDVCDGLAACQRGTCVEPTAVTCVRAGAPVDYRINVLQIPTEVRAEQGLVVGHDVDGVGDVCDVPDYMGDVDNVLIAVNAGLPGLSPTSPLDLRDVIDTALECPAASESCTRLDVIVRVRTGTGCAMIEVLDGTGESANTLAGPFAATLDASGNFVGHAPSLSLTIPYGAGSSMVGIPFQLSGVIVSGTVGETLLGAVIGGYIERADFDTTLMTLYPLLGESFPLEELLDFFESVHDVRLGGQCDGVSAGFLADGVVVF